MSAGRFIAGLFAAGVAGGVTWFFSHGDTALTICVALMVALIVWFTRVADEIADLALEFGRAIVTGLGRIID